MEALHWIIQHWMDTLQNVSILAGLLFTAYTIQKDRKEKKVGSLITFTQQYRDIWKELYERPSLARILKGDVDLNQAPITLEEELFVKFLIFHLDSVCQAMENDMLQQPEGINLDIQEFFSLPIPKTIWENLKHFRREKFISFVEGSLDRDEKIISSLLRGFFEEEKTRQKNKCYRSKPWNNGQLPENRTRVNGDMIIDCLDA